jgi:hypothetical protein
MRPRWGLSVVGGAATPVVLWLVLVPWDLGAAPARQVVTGVCGAVIIASVVGGAVTYLDRAAGGAFLVTAYVTTLVLFMAQSVAAGDLLWPFTMLVLALAALGSFVVAFAAGRFLRTRSTIVTATRVRPSIAVQVFVWVGLTILVTAVGAFILLFPTI